MSRVDPSMSVKRKVTVPVGRRDIGSPSRVQKLGSIGIRAVPGAFQGLNRKVVGSEHHPIGPVLLSKDLSETRDFQCGDSKLLAEPRCIGMKELWLASAKPQHRLLRRISPTMQCAHCGRENPAAAKFCGECGEPLTLRCPNCGEPNPIANRFCGECGTSLTQMSVVPRSASPETYTPRHLAEKILTSWIALKGSISYPTRRTSRALSPYSKHDRA